VAASLGKVDEEKAVSVQVVEAGVVKQPLLDGPFLARLEQLEIVSKKMLQGRSKGERLSKRKGQSVEFADFRNYTSGDDLRFLDWNLFARLDRLFLRIFLEEEDLRFHVMVDCSASMDFGSPTKLRYARQVAAALGYIALCNNDCVRVHAFAEKLQQDSGNLRGKRSLPRLLQYLEGIEEAGGAGSLADACKSFSLQNPTKGVVILISDFLDKSGYEQALRFLLARQYDIFVIQVLAAEEVDPPMTGDLKLTDIEDADTAEVTMGSAVVERYKSTLNAFRGQLAEFCVRRGIHYLYTTNQTPFESMVLGYLRRQGLVAG
jgi:uncharacterized protein (DUF58 family)